VFTAVLPVLLLLLQHPTPTTSLQTTLAPTGGTHTLKHRYAASPLKPTANKLLYNCNGLFVMHTMACIAESWSQGSYSTENKAAL
jgi:hypothetical protein